MRKKIVTIGGIAFATALAAAGMTAAPAGAAVHAPDAFTPYSGQLSSVSVAHSGQAWTVGATGATVIQRWNGKTWTGESWLSLSPTASPGLYSVAAVSASSAWTVGYIPAGADGYSSLIGHWNGSAWKRVPSPNPGAEGTSLDGITAVSSGNIWAVGTDSGAFPHQSSSQTVILHWNGKSWARVPSPNPGTNDQLAAVTATSANNAWAVGETQNIVTGTTGILILHWNGKTWTQVPGPAGAAGIPFQGGGVTATSASNAWIAGTAITQSAGVDSNRTMILHWNGKAWSRVPSPSPAGGSLESVTAASAGSAWAVGSANTPSGFGSETLILHWNGKAWSRIPSPNPYCSTCDSLYGVASASPGSAWAVGTVNAGGLVVILHWNGSRWVNFPSANALG
jgi:hypothetical protein